MTTSIEEDWKRAEGGVRNPHVNTELAKLQELMDSLGHNDFEDWDEIIVEQGNQPIVVRRSSTNEYLIELSASRKENLSGEISLPPSEEIHSEEILDYLENIDGPAATTEEIANKLGCSTKGVYEQLTDLHTKSLVEGRNSGNATLWWKEKNKSTQNTESRSQEEAEREEITQIPKSLKEIVAEHKEESESIEEAFRRLRGNPTPEILADILGDESSQAKKKMRKAIEQKREKGRERRKNIRDRFK